MVVYSFLVLQHKDQIKNIFFFTGFPLPSWVHTKGQGKGTLTPSPQSETPESTAIEVEDIPALLRDVARFAEAVEKLKDVVLTEGKTGSQGRVKARHKSTHTRRLQIFTGLPVTMSRAPVWPSGSLLCRAVEPMKNCLFSPLWLDAVVFFFLQVCRPNKAVWLLLLFPLHKTSHE